MTDPVHLETVLRLAAERMLLAGERHGDGSRGLGEIASVLTLCGLPREVAESVVEDYWLAQSFREAARPQLSVTDDKGTTTEARPSGSGSRAPGRRDRWQGHWITRIPLSATTRWLDLAGTRLALGEPAPPAAVRVEPLPDESPLRRYLWHRLAAGLRGPPEDEIVTDVFIQLGGLAEDDPMLAAIAEVTAALYGGPGSGTPRNVRPPWKGLFARRHRSDGPIGDVPLAAATPEFDGIVVVVYGMRSEPHGFSMRARAVGDVAPEWPFSDDISGIRLAWWAEDDRGNTHLGYWDAPVGGDGEISGDLKFHPPLDPAATQLRLMPTALRHRAVIDVPLPRWTTS